MVDVCLGSRLPVTHFGPPCTYNKFGDRRFAGASWQVWNNLPTYNGQYSNGKCSDYLTTADRDCLLSCALEILSLTYLLTYLLTYFLRRYYHTRQIPVVIGAVVCAGVVVIGAVVNAGVVVSAGVVVIGAVVFAGVVVTGAVV